MIGAFSCMSLEDMQTYFIAYNYDSNAIIPKLVSDFKDGIIIAIFEKIFN